MAIPELPSTNAARMALFARAHNVMDGCLFRAARMTANHWIMVGAFAEQLYRRRFDSLPPLARVALPSETERSDLALRATLEFADCLIDRAAAGRRRAEPRIGGLGAGTNRICGALAFLRRLHGRRQLADREPDLVAGSARRPESTGARWRRPSRPRLRSLRKLLRPLARRARNRLFEAPWTGWHLLNCYDFPGLQQQPGDRSGGDEHERPDDPRRARARRGGANRPAVSANARLRPDARAAQAAQSGGHHSRVTRGGCAS